MFDFSQVNEKNPAGQSPARAQNLPPVTPKKAFSLEKPKQSPPSPQATVFTGERKETREPMSRLRQRVAQRLKDSQNTYALLTTFQEVDMHEATVTRKVYVC